MYQWKKSPCISIKQFKKISANAFLVGAMERQYQALIANMASIKITLLLFWSAAAINFDICMCTFVFVFLYFYIFMFVYLYACIHVYIYFLIFRVFEPQAIGWRVKERLNVHLESCSLITNCLISLVHLSKSRNTTVWISKSICLNFVLSWLCSVLFGAIWSCFWYFRYCSSLV